MADKRLRLAPWAEDQKGQTDYERFHNLNELAASVCRLDAMSAMNVSSTKFTNNNCEYKCLEGNTMSNRGQRPRK